jgi:DNA invertase Pin-like site-specific DNA recombinase
VLLGHAGVFAEFETNLRRERQLEGIAKAKAAGVDKGRPPSIEASRVRELKAQGMRPVDIAKALKIGRASVYRVLGLSRRTVKLLSWRERREGCLVTPRIIPAADTTSDLPFGDKLIQREPYVRP